MTIDEPAVGLSCPHAPPEFDDLIALHTVSVEDKHGHFARLREQGPVVWAQSINAFAVTRYAEVIEVLGNPARFSSQLGDSKGPRAMRNIVAARESLAVSDPSFGELVKRLEPDWRMLKILAQVDDPQHARDRRLVSRVFSPRHVAALEPRIREIAIEAAEDLRRSGPIVDLAEGFAQRIPPRVIAEQLGVGEADHVKFKRWADDLVLPIGNDNPSPAQVKRMTLSLVELSEYFYDRFAAFRRTPNEGLASRIANESGFGSDAERLALLAQVVSAGTETTTKLIGYCLAYLAQHREVANELRRDRARLSTFVEEVLRLESPVQALYRYARDDTLLAGVHIPAGSALWVMYGAANRCSTAFDAPDSFRLDRSSQNEHVAFGRGIHYCIGATLARAETSIAVDVALNTLWPWDIDLAELVPSYMLHGHKRLLATLNTAERPSDQRHE